MLHIAVADDVPDLIGPAREQIGCRGFSFPLHLAEQDWKHSLPTSRETASSLRIFEDNLAAYHEELEVRPRLGVSLVQPHTNSAQFLQR